MCIRWVQISFHDEQADGFVFGFPTRFGMMSAQFKAFLDATGGLWRTQQLAGKPAGLFNISLTINNIQVVLYLQPLKIYIWYF